MICPECKSHNIYVKDSRHRDGFIYRRRVCNDCGKEFKTHERIIDEDCQNCTAKTVNTERGSDEDDTSVEYVWQRQGASRY